VRLLDAGRRFLGSQDWRGAQSAFSGDLQHGTHRLDGEFQRRQPEFLFGRKAQDPGKGWETVTIPFSKFKLDEYYQPKEAKEGAPLKPVSEIETSTSPETTGVHTSN